MPGKSAGEDTIPVELIQAGGETMIDALLKICNKIWQTGEWPTTWTQSLVITLPKKGNLQQCQNYQTISLISHSENITKQVEASSRKDHSSGTDWPERSTIEHIFNLRILCERYLLHQQDLFHVFVDFKKAFDIV